MAGVIKETRPEVTSTAGNLQENVFSKVSKMVKIWTKFEGSVEYWKHFTFE